jgi:hypothetical protein
MTPKQLYALLDAHGVEYEIIEIFEGARVLNIEVNEALTNYEKAVEIYEAGGQSAVFDAVNSGEIIATGWHVCEPCETESPFEGNTCLVCGTEKN